MLSNELRNHLFGRLVPFWEKLQDRQFGGYYGWMDSGLNIDEQAEKGCILNSRILWFFSNAYMCRKNLKLQDETEDEGTQEGCPQTAGSCKEAGGQEEIRLKECADWAYRFLREKCLDREKGGVYWSVDYQGQPEDTTKHTYNQAFAVYALSSYYRAFHDQEALELAESLIEVIETKCFDAYGYKEALDRDFHPVDNDKLSENGVMADRTMNTLLHVMEAYTEYLLAIKEEETIYISHIYGQIVTKKLEWMLELVEKKVYNPALRRQEVFFDRNMESLIDLHSYGHDIEAAWLMDRCLKVLGNEELDLKISPILRSLEKQVYESAYSHHSLANECERGVVDTKRVWWVQAEGVVGFFNAWQKTGEARYLQASEDIWKFIREHLADSREGGEWFWYTDAEGNPAWEKPIVEPWKCPYHNGRMCMEIIRRSREV